MKLFYRPPDIDSVQVELLGSYQVQELGASGAGLHYIAVDSSGNYAYVTNSLKGLIVLDISDPANPDSIGVYADMGEINMVLTSQEYAYAVDFSGALRILDISNPHSLVIVGSYETSDYADGWRPYSLDVQGDYAYLGCNKGLMAIDISNPTQSSLASVFEFIPDHVNGVVVRDTVAYCIYAHQTGSGGSGRSGIMTLDVSDPSDMIGLGHYSRRNETYWHLAIKGNIAYIAQGNDGIALVDISNPEIPYELATVQRYHALFHRLLISDDMLFASGWLNEGVLIYRLDDLLYPVSKIEFMWYVKSVMPIPDRSRHYMVSTLRGGIMMVRLE